MSLIPTTNILTQAQGASLAQTLLNGDPRLALSYVPPPGAVVVILIIRISPDTSIYIYENEGKQQIIQLCMAYLQLQKTCKAEQFELFPCLLGDLQISRHEPESHNAILELFSVLEHGNLSDNPVVVFLFF